MTDLDIIIAATVQVAVNLTPVAIGVFAFALHQTKRGAR